MRNPLCRTDNCRIILSPLFPHKQPLPRREANPQGMDRKQFTSLPDHRLPSGVTRALWEYAHDTAIARDYDQFTANSPLLELDLHLLRERFGQPGRLLDLGCGSGRVAIPFAQQGWEVTGVDLSLDMLQVTREKAQQAGVELSLVEANLCELNCLPAGNYDAVLLMFGTLGMIAGVENRAQVLRGAAERLRPGGRVALHVHNVWSHLFTRGNRLWLIKDRLRRLGRYPTAGDRRSPYRGIPNMYIHYFSLAEITRLLRGAGLVVRETIPLSIRQDAPLPGTYMDRHFRAGGWIVIAERPA